MIEHKPLPERGILIVKPAGTLRAEDFAALTAAVNPFIAQRGRLNGLMIDAPSFPGWENFAALLSHLRFIRDHHRQIRRIAVVSDSAFLSVAPKIANHFVSAEVRRFEATGCDAALAWLEPGAQTSG